MGGDFAPLNELLGAVSAISEDPNFDLILVGSKDKIISTAAENKIELDKFTIVDAPEVITMKDSPMAGIKSKPNSSIVVGAKLVKEKKADAFVSAGNTGAVSAASTLIIGRIEDVSRPTIMAAFPNEKGKFTFVADVGAFVDSKPNHLFDFAVLGSIFVKEIYGVSNPTIGLMNVGEEESKGYKLTTETAALFRKSELNFYGNVEGKDVFKGTVDVIVCDGFVGNIILKFAESIIPFLKSSIKEYANKSILNKIRALAARGTLKESLKNADYQVHGGVPLLGLNGISIIGHGSSSPLAIKNMILRAKEMYDKNLIHKFQESIKLYAV
ncbi:MAG: phosphate acyltransferase PlsX [Melioribacteraceae bacterium]|nr:phosphate acyltransferase PlsX [Melioribacteraceae bacterium]MCF8352826.1 phosphate acyltransferase PlsX [Melioribacteraceae bacterium]MCF8393454.1 phosphate acyltransferase PlsX [Melioribacteraceae bacterium]MCF8417343.1 phosphate acyltransferase PlsX [Melioribacteraceae bacterium]